MEVFNVLANISLADRISGPLRNVTDAMGETMAASASLADGVAALPDTFQPAALAAFGLETELTWLDSWLATLRRDLGQTVIAAATTVLVLTTLTVSAAQASGGISALQGSLERLTGIQPSLLVGLPLLALGMSVLATFGRDAANAMGDYVEQLNRATDVGNLLTADTELFDAALAGISNTVRSLLLPVLERIAAIVREVSASFTYLTGNPVADFLIETANTVGSVATSVNDAIVSVREAASTVSEVWILLRNSRIGTVAAEFIEVAKATDIWTAAQWLLDAALEANPIGVTIVAVAALVAGVIALYNNCEPVRDVIDAMWEALQQLWDTVSGFFDTLSQANVLGVLAASFKEVYAAISQLWNHITALFDIDLAETGKKVIMGLFNGIKAAITAPFEFIKSTLGKLKDLNPFDKDGVVASLASAGTKALHGIGSAVMSIITPTEASEAANVTKAAAKAGAVTRGAETTATVHAAATAVTPPDVPSPPSPAPATARNDAPGRGTAGGAGRSLVIRSLNVNLPDVRDAEGFVSALQRLVAQYDGFTAEGGIA